MLEIVFRGNREVFIFCEVCDYFEECKDYFIYIDIFIKLSEMIGVDIFIK